jgi:hypothetical protein
MSAIEEEILERLHQLGTADQQKVLEFIEGLRQPERHYTPLELLTLPEEERNRIIEESFRLAQDEDFETFEAYSEEPLDDEP